MLRQLDDEGKVIHNNIIDNYLLIDEIQYELCNISLGRKFHLCDDLIDRNCLIEYYHLQQTLADFEYAENGWFELSKVRGVEGKFTAYHAED